ncbi:MAG: MFS transporter [Alphaproteobacteria bacterium]|jgi:EmrB/QacA subfamily drug resistance transporter|nr:MFS transporter [Alphaproteobacteria bacterium]
MPKTSNTLSFQSWIMLFAIGLLIFLINIDYTAVNLALVPISEEVDSDLNTLQWLLSGYVLIWAALVVPAGRFADIYGKKFSLNLGISTFILGSVMTGLGHDVTILIAGRLIQGLGAAIFSSPAYGLVFSSVPVKKQGMAMGFVGGSAGLGLAFGPTLAGWIIKEIGWRWLFYINVPLGLLVIFVLVMYAPHEKKHPNPPSIDWLSVTLLTFGLGSAVFALNQIEVWGMSDPTLWSFGLGGLASLVLFAYRDRGQPFQILPKDIIQNKPFMSTVTGGFIMAYCFSLVLVMMALYLQNTLRLSSADTGWYFLAMTLAVGILSPVGGKLADHMDIRIPIVSGFTLSVCALFALSHLGASSSALMVCGGLLLAGLGLGIGFPSLNTAMFKTLNPAEINTGSAIFCMAMTLGNAISIIASTSFLVMFGRPKLIGLMAEAGSSITIEEQQALISIIAKVEHTPEQLKQFPAEQIPNLLGLIDQAFLYGFSLTFWIGMGLSILGIGLFLKYFKGIAQDSSQSITAPVMH